MQQHIVTELERDQRLDKLLMKYLPLAPRSFLYKMLRKKNITLNGKKAAGKEPVHTGDMICLFLSDETIEKFQADRPLTKTAYPRIIYEDKDVLLLDKPAGVLSQKAKDSDISLVEQITWYLYHSGQLTEQQLKSFHPAVCNRLDRNTSGLITAGKTMEGLQGLSALFQSHDLGKYYLCFVKGAVRESEHIGGWLQKDRQTNQVTVKEAPDPEGNWERIETVYRPVRIGDGCTLLEVRLLTGKPHQIRAHLASQGHPLAGDAKYGDAQWNGILRQKYGLKHHLLHCCRMEFPDRMPRTANGMREIPLEILGKTFTAPLPGQFRQICRSEGIAFAEETRVSSRKKGQH